MMEFQANGRTASGYLAVPEHGSGPGVVVLHAWWGLTEPFRHVCDRLAQDDSFEPPESVAEMEQALKAAGKQATFYTYPGTKHWFFEENRPEYDAGAARLAWERTIQFLQERLD
jgi:dienelactone hydrolase